MFRIVVIAFGVIVFALLSPAWKAYGVTGLVLINALIIGLWGIVVGLARGNISTSAAECFSPEWGEIGLTAFIQLLISAVVASFLTYEDRYGVSRFYVFVLSTLVAALVWYVFSVTVAYLKWKTPKR